MSHLPNLLLVEGKDDLHVIRNLWVTRFPADRTGTRVLCPEAGIEPGWLGKKSRDAPWAKRSPPGCWTQHLLRPMDSSPGYDGSSAHRHGF